MAVLVTVRNRSAEGEVIGTFIYATPYEGSRISIGGRQYVVIGTDEELGRQTLYVVPPK